MAMIIRRFFYFFRSDVVPCCGFLLLFRRRQMYVLHIVCTVTRCVVIILTYSTYFYVIDNCSLYCMSRTFIEIEAFVSLFSIRLCFLQYWLVGVLYRQYDVMLILESLSFNWIVFVT
jgi:hypothetical protein